MPAISPQVAIVIEAAFATSPTTRAPTPLRPAMTRALTRSWRSWRFRTQTEIRPLPNGDRTRRRANHERHHEAGSSVCRVPSEIRDQAVADLADPPLLDEIHTLLWTEGRHNRNMGMWDAGW